VNISEDDCAIVMTNVKKYIYYIFEVNLLYKLYKEISWNRSRKKFCKFDDRKCCAASIGHVG
jgi:hypothetical protein